MLEQWEPISPETGKLVLGSRYRLTMNISPAVYYNGEDREKAVAVVTQQLSQGEHPFTEYFLVEKTGYDEALSNELGADQMYIVGRLVKIPPDASAGVEPGSGLAVVSVAWLWALAIAAGATATVMYFTGWAFTTVAKELRESAFTFTWLAIVGIAAMLVFGYVFKGRTLAGIVK